MDDLAQLPGIGFRAAFLAEGNRFIDRRIVQQFLERLTVAPAVERRDQDQAGRVDLHRFVPPVRRPVEPVGDIAAGQRAG